MKQLENFFGLMFFAMAMFLSPPLVLPVCLVYALVVSTWKFVVSLIRHIDPYTTYVDRSPNAQPGTRRNYFFGPGYHQIFVTAMDSFALLKSHLVKFEAWRIRQNMGEWYRDNCIRIFCTVAHFLTLALAMVWLGLFASMLSVVLLGGMACFYVLFSVLWCADRIYLLARSISSRCPNCKRIAIVPAFECPNCGTGHQKLAPGPYGILERKCACGAILPATIFNGRSRLKASCPHCLAGLAASDTRQFGIQIVGGTSAGKTTFLASFWHLYLQAARRVRSLEMKIDPKDAFEALEYWYNCGMSVSTAETNANMYSAVHRLPKKTPLQFSIYDIAGEAFAKLDANIQQQQFQYCEGVVFMIDPTSSVETTEDAISGFLNAYKALRGNQSVRLSALPAAVVIAKADLFKREIGLVKIQAEHRKSAPLADLAGKGSLDRTRDRICRTFLVDRGFSNVLNLLEGEFMEIAVFPASAMGHEAKQGDRYMPWGVMEPVCWILGQADEQERAYFLPVTSPDGSKGSAAVSS